MKRLFWCKEIWKNDEIQVRITKVEGSIMDGIWRLEDVRMKKKRIKKKKKKCQLLGIYRLNKMKEMNQPLAARFSLLGF